MSILRLLDDELIIASGFALVLSYIRQTKPEVGFAVLLIGLKKQIIKLAFLVRAT